MADKTFQIEVQPDFLERQAKAKPVQAVAEFIWNGLDADATKVDVIIEHNEFGMSKISVYDNGHGIPYEEAPILFSKLGGSWKTPGALTKTAGRMLHGSEGRGRFKAFALGRVADWHVTYKDKSGVSRTYRISMVEDNLREVRMTEEAAADMNVPGVVATISELHRDFRSLETENAIQELVEIFALYLKAYSNVTINFENVRIDPSTVIASTYTSKLDDIAYEGKTYPVNIEIIEWKTATKRALYLCNEQGFPLSQVATHFHIGNFQFSAYLKSPFITQLHNDALLDLAEMNPQLVASIDNANRTIKDYFRERELQNAQAIVEEWKAEQVYPYKGDASTIIEKVERQVFDIVAIRVNEYLPDFSSSPTKSKAFQLRILRQAIERSPEELQLILKEVLDLPKRKQQELAKLLQETSLSAIISASKLVTDRLKFITGLETLVFDLDTKQHLKERSQLHRILADNAWIFGEEFSLSISDKSLTEVLRKHKRLLNEDIVIDKPVKHISQDRGIIDLMLSRSIRRRRNEIEHLIVELKAPKIKIGSDEVTQIEKYAFSVAEDERFKNINTRWFFWVVSDDIDKYAERRIKESNDGVIYNQDGIIIRIKTWAQVMDDNKARFQFFQEQLAYQVDQGVALKHLQETYEKFLTGVITEDLIEQYSEDKA